MSDRLFTLIDSNIIIDIVQEDPEWFEWSVDELSRCFSAIVNPIIFAEVCYQRTSWEEVGDLLEDLEIGFQEMPKEGLYLASQAFRAYRQRGGMRTSPLPDFFIGGHAAAMGFPVVTRDVKRFRTYFPKVELIAP